MQDKRSRDRDRFGVFKDQREALSGWRQVSKDEFNNMKLEWSQRCGRLGHCRPRGSARALAGNEKHTKLSHVESFDVGQASEKQQGWCSMLGPVKEVSKGRGQLLTVEGCNQITVTQPKKSWGKAMFSLPSMFRSSHRGASHWPVEPEGGRPGSPLIQV